MTLASLADCAPWPLLTIRSIPRLLSKVTQRAPLSLFWCAKTCAGPRRGGAAGLKTAWIVPKGSEIGTVKTAKLLVLIATGNEGSANRLLERLLF